MIYTNLDSNPANSYSCTYDFCSELLHDKALMPQHIMMNSSTFNTEPGPKAIKHIPAE